LFGDPSHTGKGALSDLREGKRTLLMLKALDRARPAERDVLADCLGNPGLDEDAASRVREIVVDSGALAAVERLLVEQQALAHRALAGVAPPARQALEELAEFAANRTG
jgi:geranylgeranyl diphosphate synthase, type I